MSLRIVNTIRAIREELRAAKRPAGFVPTMGALHAGHISLIDRARWDNETVIVSVFVNPIQFNQQQDFDLYPRTLERDAEMCAAAGVDLIFAPSVQEMYPQPLRTFVDVERVSEHLCGQYRPGHFRGVATVVMKLFQIVQADRAYFGEKDAQQLAVIRRMVRDLDVPVSIIGVPTVRAEDGLALSSRNERLTPEQRRQAPVIYRALQAAARIIESGERSTERIKQEALALLRGQPGMRVEYFEVVDADEMQPLDSVSGPVRIATAVWAGGVRLIDNVPAIPPATSS